jgi:hypothetical protein
VDEPESSDALLAAGKAGLFPPLVLRRLTLAITPAIFDRFAGEQVPNFAGVRLGFGQSSSRFAL